MDYDQDEYYRHYILEFLREVELSANSELVRLLKSGDRRVTKKDLIIKYGQGKNVIVKQTKLHPEILKDYRLFKQNSVRQPLTHEELAEIQGESPDWVRLLSNLQNIDPSDKESKKYEKAIQKLLCALFYPNLTNPRWQYKIHEGRKRIDITFTNMLSGSGFFTWLGQHYSAPHVFVECKNYGTEVANPELDQLTGRFSPSRGLFGILVCRCRDTALDGRGYVIPLDDGDLKRLVVLRRSYKYEQMTKFIKSKFDRIIM
jgi:phage pi2 protein 07